MKGRSRRGTDRGAVLVIFALCISVLFLIVAIVIDLGATRSDRRGGQSAVDSSAIGAAQTLDEATAVEACEDALDLLALNLETPAFAYVGPSCADQFTAACGALERTVTATSGDYTARIVHPVLTLDRTTAINSSAVPFDSDTDGEPCERIGVEVTTDGASYFGGIAGSSGRSSVVHAVAMAQQPPPNQRVVPAFLMLDRTACKSIETATGVNSAGLTYPDGSQRPDGILVHKTSVQPGIIHADSNGSGCGNAAGDRVVWGSRPSSLNSIYVEPLNATTLGVVSAAAPEAIVSGGGINVSGVNDDVVSRSPVDGIYQSAITAFHADARSAVTATGQPANSNRYNCTGAPIGTPNPAFTIAYIDCDEVKDPLAFSGAETSVVFKGRLDLGNADRVALANAATITIRGGVKVAGGGNENWASFQAPVARTMYVGGRIEVTGNGVLNIGAPVVTSNVLPTCGGVPPTTRVAIFSTDGDSNPALDIAGKASMCATSIYLAGPRNFPSPLGANSPYRELSRETGAPDCSPAKPCPWVSGNPSPGARFALTGEVTWRAPNTSNSPLPQNLALNPAGGIEDLAFWGESGEESQVKSGATLNVAGVFFAPNSRMLFQSGNAASSPVDAQFIARTVYVQAGMFTMRPSIANTVPVPAPRILALIR